MKAFQGIHPLRSSILGMVLIAGCAQKEAQVHPVVLLGIDGATWDVIDPMMERGELPSFRRLVERGCRAPLLSIPPLASPAVWTSIATGRYPRDHGILDHAHPYVEGPKTLVDAGLRRDPALWNIVAHYGRTVGTVGYHTSHPVDRVEGGFMVSDRASLGLEGGVWPDDLLDGMRAELDEIDEPDVWRQLLGRFLPWDYDPAAVERTSDRTSWPSKLIRGRVDRQIRMDEYARRVALGLVPRGLDLFMVNLYLVDHACHSAWWYYDDGDFDEKPDPSDRELLAQLIPESYRYMDDFLGELLAALGEEVNLVLVSDHGSGSATGPYAIGVERLRHLTGNHRHDGILLAAGPDIRPGALEGLCTLDVTPTILTLLGIPISEELEGRVEPLLLREGFLEERAPERVPAYDIEWRSATDEAWTTAESDEEGMDALKALGYVGESTPVAGERTRTEHDFWTIEPRIRRSVLEGELLHLLIRGRLERAQALFEELARRDSASARFLPKKLQNTLGNAEAELGHELLSSEASERLAAWRREREEAARAAR
jgi:predicted AlkP superfamily phosphohydrolase/phosphomutase